jgi:hypothetical protein
VDDRGEHQITCGLQEWYFGTTTLFDNVFHTQYQPEVMNVCAKAGWRNENEFEMSWCFVNTPFIDTVVCHFDGNQIWLKRTVNTDQGDSRPTLNGTM